MLRGFFASALLLSPLQLPFYQLLAPARSISIPSKGFPALSERLKTYHADNQSLEVHQDNKVPIAHPLIIIFF
jgi:hypothetical protein